MCIQSFPWSRHSLQFPEVAVTNISVWQVSKLREVKQLAVKHTGDYSKTDLDTVFLTPNLEGFVAVLLHCFHLGLEFLQ